MRLSFISGLLFLTFACSSVHSAGFDRQVGFLDRVETGYNDVRAAVDNFNSSHGKSLELLNILGALLHIPYIVTLDSNDARAVCLAGALATLPTSLKVCLKFVHKPQDERFYKIFFYDGLKFGSYLSAAAYDGVNFLNAEHMILERQQKGADLKLIKKDQAILLAFEILLRFFAYVAAYKAESADVAAGADLAMIASLISEAANLTELWRLLGRYQTYITTPGIDVVFHVDVKHAGSLNDLSSCEDVFFSSSSSVEANEDKEVAFDTVSANNANALA
jgi:hypothetical protein